MSRSYKKHPFLKDNQNCCHEDKKIVSRRLRRGIPVESEESEILANSPSAFKKINKDTWDIHDYVSFETEEDARKYYRKEIEDNSFPAWTEKFLKQYPTEDDFIQKYWAKYFKRK